MKDLKLLLWSHLQQRKAMQSDTWLVMLQLAYWNVTRSQQNAPTWKQRGSCLYVSLLRWGHIISLVNLHQCWSILHCGQNWLTVVVLYHISDEVTSRLIHHNNYCSYGVIYPSHTGLPFDGVDWKCCSKTPQHSACLQSKNRLSEAHCSRSVEIGTNPSIMGRNCTAHPCQVWTVKLGTATRNHGIMGHIPWTFISK